MSHVPQVVVLADRVDETARLADYVVATAHPLASWFDVEPVAGLPAVVQPAMQPIGQVRSFGDSLAAWAAGLGHAGRW